MSEFKMKDLGKLYHFIRIDFHITQGYVKMNQNKYIGRVLERFNMSNCKPRATPCELKMDLNNNSEIITLNCFLRPNINVGLVLKMDDQDVWKADPPSRSGVIKSIETRDAMLSDIRIVY